MKQIHKYSKQEIQFLRDNVEGISLKELTRRFNQHFNTNLSENSIAAQKNKHRLKSGIVGGRFEKGHIPANKGQKMPADAYERAKKTMFKPGSKPKNTDPIGTEKKLTDGYIWVKVDNQTNVPKVVNWRQKHRLIWEKKHGPIPEGNVIIFLDGNHENFDLDNLEMITKQENLVMNRNKLFKNDKDLTKIGVQIARMLCTTYNVKKSVRKG